MSLISHITIKMPKSKIYFKFKYIWNSKINIFRFNIDEKYTHTSNSKILLFIQRNLRISRMILKFCYVVLIAKVLNSKHWFLTWCTATLEDLYAVFTTGTSEENLKDNKPCVFMITLKTRVHRIQLRDNKKIIPRPRKSIWDLKIFTRKKISRFRRLKLSHLHTAIGNDI